MSTERIINRVSNAFVENEQNKLLKDSQKLAQESFDNNNILLDELKESFTPPAQPEVETTPSLTQTTVYQDGRYLRPAGDVTNQEAFQALKDAMPMIDEALDSPVVQEVLEQKGLKANEELLNSFRALVGGDDFKVFRSQVIRAFKHAGFDTIRFFGE